MLTRTKSCVVCNKLFNRKPKMGGVQWSKMRYCSRTCKGTAQTTDPQKRFWEKVRKTDGCWLWIARAKTQFGYGCFSVIRDGLKIFVRAHRYAYEIANGPIKDGLFVLHRCDNPACVRPDHLFLGTQTDNMEDMDEKGRRGKPEQSGSKNSNARLTQEDIAKIRSLHGCCSQKEIAEEYGISATHVGRICRGKAWKEVS